MHDHGQGLGADLLVEVLDDLVPAEEQRGAGVVVFVVGFQAAVGIVSFGERKGRGQRDGVSGRQEDELSFFSPVERPQEGLLHRTAELSFEPRSLLLAVTVSTSSWRCNTDRGASATGWWSWCR